MQVSYKKLFDKLALRGINQKELMKNSEISPSVMQKIRHNEFINLKTVGRICVYLDCTPNDILEIIPDSLESQIAELQAKLKTLQEGEE